METIKIDADRMFRAVTAGGYKLLAYNFDVRTGEIVSRTLTPDEVKAEAEGSSVKPLPKLGWDLARKQAFVAPSNAPLGAAPISSKPKLFAEDDTPKSEAFGSDFWKRDAKGKPALFAEGFKKENATKKLAEIFGGKPALEQKSGTASDSSARKRTRPDGKPRSALAHAPDDPYYPRVPVADEAALRDWMRDFGMQYGDPQIREQLLAALAGAKCEASFERVLRQHPRMAQQWEKHLRKMALACADVWLESLGLKWEWVESEEARRL